MRPIPCAACFSCSGAPLQLRLSRREGLATDHAQGDQSAAILVSESTSCKRKGTPQGRQKQALRVSAGKAAPSTGSPFRDATPAKEIAPPKNRAARTQPMVPQVRARPLGANLGQTSLRNSL